MPMSYQSRREKYGHPPRSLGAGGQPQSSYEIDGPSPPPASSSSAAPVAANE
ncbi:hypothetical protein [Streptomyces sp. SLBN-8D4]|uniref:hypothetical protein n=1 Tax=Streptomyces sp. SLBN-8D4 TaxID=3377728 RepID=UPI003C79C4C6